MEWIVFVLPRLFKRLWHHRRRWKLNEQYSNFFVPKAQHIWTIHSIVFLLKVVLRIIFQRLSNPLKPNFSSASEPYDIARLKTYCEVDSISPHKS